MARIWNGSTFVTYATVDYANYPISMTQQGTLESFYAGNFPLTAPNGVYNVVVKNQVGVSPAETDPAVAMGDIQWNGDDDKVMPLTDLATSGQVSRYAPYVALQGQMIDPFTFKLVSAADSRTPFTSGALGLSGQISKDGSDFGPFESGAFTEMGLGWYALQALTSGDTNCRVASLNFKSVVSGIGESDPRDFQIIFQKTSG